MSEKRRVENNEILALLDLASAFASKRDVRVYLNDINYYAQDDKQYIQAANGHILVRITLNNYEPLNLPRNIEIKSAKSAIKVCELSLIKNNPETDGIKYPDINRIIPIDINNTQELPSFNAGYLGTAFTALEKCVKKINGQKFVGVKCVQINNKEASLFVTELRECTIKIEIIIMPMRL